MYRPSPATAAAALLFAAACADPATAPLGLPDAPPSTALYGDEAGADGQGVFHRYVAIGTSISMGWQSEGVVGAGQRTSWPAQLARLGGRELPQPYVAPTGCRSPLVAPLASGLRLSGEGAGANPATLSCSALEDGITLPTRNLAINAATTRDALFTTPQNVTDASNARLYPLVLPTGQSQVSAMMALNPKLVSVELGGNEVLNARSGIAVEGVTIFPYDQWVPLYNAVLDSAQKAAPLVMTVGLVHDVASLPAFRTGAELWADRAAFQGFNVLVAPDCEGSANLLFVPVRVTSAVATGVARARQGLSPFVLSCAAGGPVAQDFVLSPAEAGTVNAILARMNAHMRAQAERRGFAYFELEALYGRTDVKAPFSVMQHMMSTTPYGAYVSLDGIHPSEHGATIIAAAAKGALEARYPRGLFSGEVLASR